MEDVNKGRRIFLSLSVLKGGPQEINSWDIRLHLTFQETGINVAKCKKREFSFKVMFSLLSLWSMLKLAYISTHSVML